MIDVRRYLEAKNLRVREATQGNIHMACPFCLEDESKRGRLYVQTQGDQAGCYYCFRCGEKGGINRLRVALGDPPLDDDEKEEDWRAAKDRQKALAFAADYYANNLASAPQVQEYLQRSRGLTQETIADARLGFSDGNLKIAATLAGIDLDSLKACGLVYPDGREFFIGYITIPYFTGGHVSLIRGRAFDEGGSAKYKTPLGQSPKLYNSDITFTTEGEITIVEGELDALTMTQIGIPAVACPGVTAWDDKWADYFKDFRRIFVMFDPDQPGKNGAEKVADALSPRARIVELPPPDAAGTKYDPTELYVTKGWGKDEFDSLLAKAKGGLLKTAQDAYDEWKHMQEVEGLQTGYDSMDIILHPGLLGGQVFILGAASGSGKTIFLINLMHRVTALNQDAKILFISLEQTEHEWFERARRVYRFYNPTKGDVDALRYWKERIWIVDENVVSPQKMREIIEQFAMEVGQVPDLLVVDYLGYWARGFKGEAYERTSAAVMALKAISKEFRVPTIAPHQLSRTSNPGEEPNAASLRESGVVLETADFAAFMWAPDQRHGREADDMTGERLIRLSKSRHGGVGHLWRFRLAPLSLVLIPEHEAQVELAKREIGYSLIGDDFNTALWRHRTGVTSTDLSKYMKEGRLMTPSELDDDF
jgi:hypothetical protein